MAVDEHREQSEREPSSFALGLTAAVLFVAASYVTATLLYAIVGKTGLPVSPLLIVLPAIPIYMMLIRTDERLSPGAGKDRLLIAACFGPLAISLALVVFAPLPVLVDDIPRGGAFGLTLTVCVLTVVALIARGQWIHRDKH